MTDVPDQREYYRIDDRLTIEYRGVDEAEFERLETLIRYNPAYSDQRGADLRFLDEVMSRRKGEDRELLACLRVIEQKLDTVISLLKRESEEGSYRLMRGPINVSGAGLKFNTHEELRQGERLELRLALPIAPFPKISVLAEVVRTEHPSDATPGEWKVAVKFLVVNDTDRDVLINYIFTKEREKLRSDKGTG